MRQFADEKGSWFLQFVQELSALAWVKDSHGRYLYVNAAAAQAFGLDEDAILGRTDNEIFPADTAESFTKNDQLALEQKKRLQTVEILNDKNGLPRYSLVAKFPLLSPDGATYIAGTAIDITEQRTVYAHQEFLFNISEMIRVARDPESLMRDAAVALGEFLGVDRCLFNEIDLETDREIVRSEFTRTGASVIGEHRVSAYSPGTTASMRDGKTVVNRDSKTDERTAAYFDSVYGPAGERSYVAVPMMRDLQWVASLWCSSRSPRNWTDQAIQLVEGVAERIWAAVERLRNETRLRQYAERSSLLLELGDLTRKISDPVQIQIAVADLLGKYLGANRVTFADIDGETAFVRGAYDRGVKPLPERLNYRDLGSRLVEQWSSGIPVVVNDIESDPRFDEGERVNLREVETRAFITTTFLKKEEWIAGCVVQNSSACRWTDFEIELVREIAERTWDTVERVRSEEIAARAQRTFFDLIEQAPFGVYIVDSEFKVVMVNRDSQEGAFKNVRPLIGRPFEEVMHTIWPDEVASGIVNRFRHTLETGEDFFSKDFIETREDIDQTQSYEWQLHRIVLPNGSPGVVCYYFDSTRLREAEMAVRESEARFRDMADHAPVMIWVTDADGKITYLSKSWYEFTGQTSEEAVGFGFLEAIHPEDRERDSPRFFKAVKAHGPFHSEHRLRRADGSYGWMISTAQPRTSATGEFLGHIGSVLEINDRKVAEEKLRESLDLNQSVIDSITSHIAVLDADGKITLVNRAWIEFAKDNGSQWSLGGVGPGVNYLHVCEKAVGDDRTDAMAVHKGISAILSGASDSFSLEYPCHSPDSQRFFLLTVSPLIGGGAVISHQDITDRRITENEIRNVAERLSLAQEAGNIGIWDWNASTNETYWSDQMWELYGGRPEVAKPTADFWEEHLYPPDKVCILDGVSEHLAGADSYYRHEFRIVCPDGEIRWIESSATIERNEDGSPKRMYGVNLDITDRRSIEERVRASENQLRLITDSLPALVSYIGSDGKYKFVNRRYTEWFGEPAEKIVGSHMNDVLGESAVQRLEPYIKKVLSGEVADFETWLDYKGAGRKYVHVAYVPDTGPDGKVAGYYALVSDLTEHRRSEELLRMSEDRMKILTDSFTDYAILSVDRNGMIDGWNPGAVNIFGYSDSEILGHPIDELFTPEDRDRNIPQLEMQKAAEFGRASDERWHLRKDGSRFYASGVMAPLYVGGELMGFAKIAADLTEKRRQAEELQGAYEEMELRVHERTKELAGVNESLLEQIKERKSVERQRITLLQRIVTTQEDERRRIARDLHDQLGQRLTALRLKLTSLGDLCRSDAEMSSRVQRIQQIAELLDSEVSFLAWQLRPTALDELGLVDALETFVSEWSRHYDKSAEFHHTGVSSLSLDTEVKTQVYRITQEALNNVVKHAEARNVSVILERMGESIVLIIEDDGKGFDEGSVATRSEGPPGLGLAGMKERAGLIRGDLEIESERGRGTTIYVRVPIDENTEDSLTP